MDWEVYICRLVKTLAWAAPLRRLRRRGAGRSPRRWRACCPSFPAPVVVEKKKGGIWGMHGRQTGSFRSSLLEEKKQVKHRWTVSTCL